MFSITNFTLTGVLAIKTAEMDSKAKNVNTYSGRCVSRLINLTACLTALVETVAHLAIGILTTFTGVGIVGSIVNHVCKRNVSPLTFSGGFKNIRQAFRFAPGVFFAPLAGFISPTFLSNWYNGLRAEQIEPKNSIPSNTSFISPVPVNKEVLHSQSQAPQISNITQEQENTINLPNGTFNDIGGTHSISNEIKKTSDINTQTLSPEENFKQISVPDNGKVIEYEWKFHEFKAKETVIRASTFVFLKESAEKELAYLEKHSPSLPYRGMTVEKRKQQLTKRIFQCQNNFKTRDWATSNYFRDFLRGRSKLQSNHPFEVRLGTYKQIIEEEYLPASINMRSHFCHISGGDVNVVERIGVISDMSNGFTNLKELKEIKEELEKNGLSKKLATLKNNIQKIATKEKHKGNKHIEIATAYALDQVKNLTALEATIAARRIHLEDQFLQLVMQHVNSSNRLDQLTDFSMIHVGLLCQDKEEIDNTGWNHNEANEMSDMAEIFNEFRGKSIIFDGTGPFIDEKGNIHVPKQVKNKSLTLNPFFVNSSVQGHSKKSKNKTAIDINLNSFKELKKLLSNHEEILTEMSLIFDKGNDTSYVTAINLIYWARQADLMISTGCLSAKDRTGFTCAGDSVLNQMHDLPLAGKRKFMKEQMKKDAPPVLVVRDNNPDTHIIKVTPFFIPKITDTPSGVISRAGGYTKQGVEILLERRRIEKQINGNTK